MDELSGYNLDAFTFLLRNILPESIIWRSNRLNVGPRKKRVKEKADKLMGSTDNPPGEEIHEIINTGSQAEVLSFPMIQSKENSPCNFQVDIDSMIVLKNFVAISPEERDEVTITSPFDQAEQLIIDYDHTPPGYVRLRSDRGYFGVAFDEDCSGKGSIIKGVERKPFTFFDTMSWWQDVTDDG
ncbi:uncharacterized protein [Clytia hemisphaerica]|uniref:uncharacterized protein isoform X4 n=1 Tax=Clytia hemisphaerica TaxID=252671 RepID=UPI0034D41993